MRPSLRSYQRAIVERMLAGKGNVWAGMGTGKTLATLVALDILYNLDHCNRPTLILAPKRVAMMTWPGELERWGIDLSMSVVVGTAREREAALRRRAQLYVTNYDNLPWLRQQLGRRWPFGTVIADESTKLKSFHGLKSPKGVRGRALAQTVNATDLHTNLTGTPAPNGLIDLWGQQWFVDQGTRLGRTYSAYKDRWFNEERVGDNEYATAVAPRPGAMDQIQELVSDCTISVQARDFMDLPELIEKQITVRLPPRARQEYDRMERALWAEMEAGEVIAVNAADKTGKLLQLASGALYTDRAGSWEDVHSEKLDALQDVIDDAAGMPVLVAYQFKSDLARLQRAFPQARAMTDDPRIEKEWNAGKIPILLAHPQSAGHGLNLQWGSNIIVYFTTWWGLEYDQQILERIGPTRQAQAGLNRPVHVIRLVAEDTVDELAIERQRTKASVQDLLVARMRRDK